MSSSTRMRVSLEVVGVLSGVSRDCLTFRFFEFINHILRFCSSGRRAANKWRPDLSELPRAISKRPPTCPENPSSWGQHHLDSLHWLWVWTISWYCLDIHGYERWHQTWLQYSSRLLWICLEKPSGQHHKHCWSSFLYRRKRHSQGLEAWMGWVKVILIVYHSQIESIYLTGMVAAGSMPKSGVLYSPYYTSDIYPNSHDSTQTIQVAEGKTISFTFTNFNTEPEYDWCWDHQWGWDKSDAWAWA